MTANAPRSIILRPRSAHSVWRWAVFLSLAGLIAIAGVMIYRFVHRSALERGMSELVKAYDKRRVIEPRLSGGFHAGVYRSGDDLDSIDASQLEKAIDMIGSALAEGNDSQAMTLKGRLLAAQGRNADALRSLGAALKMTPSSPEVHNDLGSCLYASGDLDGALDQFEAALTLNQKMQEALFNRALCYQRLQLPAAARAEFSNAAKTERDQGWLSEIRDRIEQVSRPIPAPISLEEVVNKLRTALATGDSAAASEIVNKNTSQVLTRSYILQDEYLDAAGSDDFARAENALSELEQIGTVFRDTRGDAIVADLATYLRSLTRQEIPEEKGLDQEWKAALKRQYSDSSAQISVFERLAGKFGARGNTVFQHRAGYNLAVCLYTSNRFTESIQKLVQQVSSAEQHKWYYYEELGISQMASNYSRLGQDSLAIRYCSRTNDPAHYTPYFEAKAQQYVGLSYWHLGDLDRALASLRKSIDILIRETPSKNNLAYNYLNIADIYRLRGSHRLAVLYAEAAVAFAEEAKDSDLIAQSCSFGALEMATTGEALKAREHLQLAFDSVSRMDPGPRHFTEPLVYLRAAAIAIQQGDDRGALEHYSKAQEALTWPEADITLRIETLRGQAKTLLSEGQIGAARSDLQRAIDLIEYQRGRIAESGNRSHYLDATRGIFDEVISLNARGFGSSTEAFNMSERSRSRTLFDEISMRNKLAGSGDASTDMTAESTRTLELGEIQRALPQDLTLLEFAVTGTETSIFVVTKSELVVKSSPVTSETLRALVNDYVALVEDMAPLSELTERARYLYDLLIGPVETVLRDKSKIAIIPDESLHFLPFACLVDGSGSYLMQTHSLTYAPSASVLVDCLREAGRKNHTNPERVLVVGNPAYDTRVFPRLRPLPEAEVEVAQVAGLYPGSRLLTGTSATKKMIQSALADSDMAHLALHCVIDETSPGEARLVLAPPHDIEGAIGSRGGANATNPRFDDGVLSLSEIYDLRLQRMGLVVLSACQSGVGQYYRGEGMVSLVYPFIVAKVPTLVASLWSVQSEATSQLMYGFHLARAAEKWDVGESLRRAQIRMLGDDRYKHPFYWGAFIAVGSDR
jgi:CHAT domain-containing protein/tetratricopeptide (TPR) repeat protein